MEAGTRLVPEEIAESLTVSKSPVREALLSLQKENLVSNIARVGFFVAEIRAEDIDEIYPIRAALISLTVQIIIAKEFEPDFLEGMGAIVEQMRLCAQKEDVEGYFYGNVKLYNLYAEACPNLRLNDLNRQLGKQVLRFRRLGMALPGRIQRSFQLNEMLVRAIVDRNAVQATQTVEQIISEGAHAIKQQIESGSKNKSIKNNKRPNYNAKRNRDVAG